MNPARNMAGSVELSDNPNNPRTKPDSDYLISKTNYLQIFLIYAILN